MVRLGGLARDVGQSLSLSTLQLRTKNPTGDMFALLRDNQGRGFYIQKSWHFDLAHVAATV